MGKREFIGIDPSATLSVSVTKGCPLNCAHCGGHYLKHMVQVEDLEKYAEKYKSFLISGGMLPNGEIPFGKYISFLKELKEKYGLKYNFHIGFPLNPPYEIEEVADVVSFDFYADKDVLKEIYGIEREPEQILDAVLPLKVQKVPHITIGVLCGKISHEGKALEVLSEYFESVVLNVFIPTPLTRYANCQPPEIDEVEKIFEKASKLFNNVVLGCMHPRGEYRKQLQERIQRHAGFIVKPTDRTYDYHGCCSFYVK
ncbi:radical SAM protein [Fervidobacterium islandicum]|uniref:Radical SAM protein n=1 Tax=Fervidobacterium islandicum TaxID=2423 RepID=A0AAI8CMS1_FERIS|nr:radical SAM protein [Fervidobacterium islandicum]AMW33803.2 radical SAM protein [Fervidobacterium islandicum]